MTTANAVPSRPLAAGAMDCVVSGLLLSLWFIMEVVVDPRGEFPLNDDWLFHILVRKVSAGEGYNGGFLPNMTLFSHILWGSGVCFISSCSFQDLRIATSIWGGVGVLVAYGVLRQVGAPLGLAGFGALLLAINPLYVAMSNTFMTDVPFLVWFVTSIGLLMLYRERRSPFVLLCACTVCCWATLSRQIEIAVPAAFLAAALISDVVEHRRIRVSVASLASAIPLLCSVGVFIAFEAWQAHGGQLPAGQSEATGAVLHAVTHPVWLVHHVAGQALIAAPYFGWFMAPLLLLPLRNRGAGKPVLTVSCRILSLIVLGLAIVTFVQIGHVMPISRNVIIPQGIGPLTLHDAYPYGHGVLGLESLPPIPKTFWWTISAAGCIGLFFLTERLLFSIADAVADIRRRPTRVGFQTVFLWGVLALYLVPVFIIDWYDRYLLPMVPVLLALLIAQMGRYPGVQQASRWRHVAAAGLCLATAGLAILGTADYLSWNRARWALLQSASGFARPDQIDGGLEFNGAYLARPDYRPLPGRSWWWVEDDLYIIAFAPLPGWSIVQTEPYHSFMQSTSPRLFLLRRPGA